MYVGTVKVNQQSVGGSLRAACVVAACCVCTGSEPAAASPLHHVLCCEQGPLDK